MARSESLESVSIMMLKTCRAANQAISSCIVIKKNHMAALFPSQVGIMLQHILDDIAVAHLGLDHFNAQVFHRLYKAKIAHHSRYDSIVVVASLAFAYRGRRWPKWYLHRQFGHFHRP